MRRIQRVPFEVKLWPELSPVTKTPLRPLLQRRRAPPMVVAGQRQLISSAGELCWQFMQLDDGERRRHLLRWSSAEREPRVRERALAGGRGKRNRNDKVTSPCFNGD
ncbi:hypothetical protein PanWU01x14_330660 [Parasponia andersonii]|uniref:Uncharacterized protein n=1 Tax=Parasponia andersonii TaxID=3476 RepID=A0A2P5AHY2_PARAD|nr:hypothetical protein PanWU01x14_330660 [Parasponia andersonii]